MHAGGLGGEDGGHGEIDAGAGHVEAVAGGDDKRDDPAGTPNSSMRSCKDKVIDERYRQLAIGGTAREAST